MTEGDGVVEVCVAIITPEDPATLNSGYNALLNFTTADDTAIGKGQHVSYCIHRLFSLSLSLSLLLPAGEDYEGLPGIIVSLNQTSPRMCFDISIRDDNILETPEDFLGELILLGPVPPATNLGTAETTVTVFDNDSKPVARRALVYEVHYLVYYYSRSHRV